jgi:hypothetical protein
MASPPLCASMVGDEPSWGWPIELALCTFPS